MNEIKYWTILLYTTGRLYLTLLPVRTKLQMNQVLLPIVISNSVEIYSSTTNREGLALLVVIV